MPIVATVAGRPIPLTRLDAREALVRRGRLGRHMPPGGGAESDRLRRWLVQELVTEAILAHEARLAAEIGDAVRGAQAQGIRAEVFDRVTHGVSVTDGEVRAYYRRNRDLFQQAEVRCIRHLVLTDERAARRAARGRAQLMTGHEWELRRGEFTGPLEDAVFAARVGDLIGPIQSEHGWHVARLETVEPARQLRLSEVRASIEAELLVVARLRAFDAWLDGQRRALAVIEPMYEHPDHPNHGVPRHRH